MNGAILKALSYLNEIEVRGERNCTLLAAAIKELKPLQTIPFAVSTPNDEPSESSKEGSK